MPKYAIDQGVKASIEQQFNALTGQLIAQTVAATTEQYELAGSIYRTAMDIAERPLLERTISQCLGNQSQAAQLLGMNRATLRTKLKRHGLL